MSNWRCRLGFHKLVKYAESYFDWKIIRVFKCTRCHEFIKTVEEDED